MMTRTAWIAIVAALALSGCDKKPEPTPEPRLVEPAHPPAPGIKLTFGFLPVDEANDDLKQRAQALANALTSGSGFEVTPMFPKSYEASIRALKRGRADAVVLSSVAYLQAHYTADADLLLADTRDGSPTFSAHWYALADSELTTFEQVAGKRVAFIDPHSAEGFLFPYALLLQQGVLEQGADIQKAFEAISFTGSEQESFRALQAGQVDAIAASERGLQALSEDARSNVRALGQVDDVPTQVIAVRADIDPERRNSLIAGFNKLSAPELLEVIGGQKFEPRSHGDHVMRLQELQELVGLDYTAESEPEVDGEDQAVAHP